jgi:hypothetical protein
VNKKINKLSDEVTKIIKELLETTEENAKEIVYKYLNKTSNTFDYSAFQTIQNIELKRELEQMIDEAIARLDQAVDNSTEIAEYNTSRIKAEIKTKTNALMVASLREHKLSVIKVVRDAKTVPLRQAIFNQTQVGLDKAPKIRTKRGLMGYKEYMEMSVRTTMQNELGEQQLKFNVDAKVVFYISSVFKDAADDHAPYQGKYYYDERYRSYGYKTDLLTAIENRINELNMLSVQEVRDNPPYLTTRPNCRHRLTPVSIKKVLTNMPEELYSDMRLTDGTYKDKNYLLSQEQRKNERMIRKYKARKEQNLKLYEQTQDENYLNASRQDQILVRRWQSRQRQLLRANPQLERDYRRETKNIIIRDLGVRYNS